MTIDLVYLVWTVALTVVLVLVAVTAAMLQVGLPALAGNREKVPALSGFAGRADRLHRNMLENLPLFVALVLVAAVAHRSNGATAAGAALFFWARVAHALIYLIGVPWLRTLAWGVSVAGMVIIFAQLVMP